MGGSNGVFSRSVRDCRSSLWDCQSSLTAQQWNKPSIDFYTECLKADTLSEWDTMRIEGEEGIARLVGFSK